MAATAEIKLTILWENEIRAVACLSQAYSRLPEDAPREVVTAVLKDFLHATQIAFQNVNPEASIIMLASRQVTPVVRETIIQEAE